MIISNIVDLKSIARIPSPDDNVAIAVKNLNKNLVFCHNNKHHKLDHTVLEGHRFAIKKIKKDEELLSWGFPFGKARSDINIGNYICNKSTLEAIRGRAISSNISLPVDYNFYDDIKAFSKDKIKQKFKKQIYSEKYHESNFLGYWRDKIRGVGTRNDIIILGTSSKTNSFVRVLSNKLNKTINLKKYSNIDGIIPLAHTEGGEQNPNNLNLVLRTLSGFFIHPNVGAILIVDYGNESINNKNFEKFLIDNKYPYKDVIHKFFSIDNGFEDCLIEGANIVNNWVNKVNLSIRTNQPLKYLKLALQCGGSDAFSGISGNPVVSWVSKEIISLGGFSNLAETDELIGAEPYILENVKDYETASKFLNTIERFKKWAKAHGASAEGNPSGGNKFRGLYNITLKSIGAGRKKHPDVRLDKVIDYGELMTTPGYYFMDSPGNDLESIAGQVASGCNLIFFVTGNGSVTNFSFVPTIKVVTTTERFNLLSKDMDFNAGAYLDGTSMDELGENLLNLTIKIASGEKSVGEKAGHSQSQIWRNWKSIKKDEISSHRRNLQLSGDPIKIQKSKKTSNFFYKAIKIEKTNQIVNDQIGLILPTSLCAAQIARLAAETLNKNKIGIQKNISRYVALVHTEGCGSSPDAHDLYIQTLLNYSRHPWVKHCMFIEHGCEATHNDYVRGKFKSLGISQDKFGWTSIQLDGGIDAVLNKIVKYFSKKVEETYDLNFVNTGLGSLKIGLQNDGPLNNYTSKILSEVCKLIVSFGGTIVIPENSDLISNKTFAKNTFKTNNNDNPVTLGYAEKIDLGTKPGLHIMKNPTNHWVETTVGLGATGVDMILANVENHSMQGNPMLPMIQISSCDTISKNDIDFLIDPRKNENISCMIKKIINVAERKNTTLSLSQENFDFQVTRGMLGISL